MESPFCLVVPCYNEAKRLDAAAFRNFLERARFARVLFVDDGSTDATLTLVSSLATELPDQVAVLRQPHNMGKAEAVRMGMLRALASDASYVGFWDADLATPLDAVFDFVGILRRRPDIDWVIGARVQLLGRAIERRALRHYLGRVFATAASTILAMPVYDTQCGAKLFRADDDLAEVLNAPFVSKWVFDVEMIARLRNRRVQRGGPSAQASIFELPLDHWRDVAGSKVKGRDFAKATLELLRIWLASRSPADAVVPSRP